MNNTERPLERALFASTREDMEARLGQYNTELTGALQASLSRAEKEIRHQFNTMEARQTAYEARSNARIQALEKKVKYLQALLP